MKYVIDLDAFIDCLDCLDSIKVNNVPYVSLPLLKEFIVRFPIDKVKEECTEYELEIDNFDRFEITVNRIEDNRKVTD